MAKRAKPSKTVPRNAIVVACRLRYGQTTKVMADRRKTRGGDRDRQRAYLDGEY